MTKLFYKETRGSLVFSTPAAAERVSQIHCALRASTWGEMKMLLPPGELQILESSFPLDEDGIIELPADDATDPSDYVPGFTDGDYPQWLQAEQDRLLPHDLLGRFGIRETSVLNGDFWTIDPSNEAALITELQARGIEAQRRDDLNFY